MTLDPTTSIKEAQDWLRIEVEKGGADCPVCTQFAKVYRRKITSSAARGIIVMYRTYGRAWGHVPTTAELSRLGGELARLSYWGLVEEDDRSGEEGSTHTGWWRVTEDGEAYVLDALLVPKYARVYNGRCLGLLGEMVTIKDALATKFDYADLMKGI